MTEENKVEIKENLEAVEESALFQVIGRVENDL